MSLESHIRAEYQSGKYFSKNIFLVKKRNKNNNNNNNYNNNNNNNSNNNYYLVLQRKQNRRLESELITYYKYKIVVQFKDPNIKS